MFCDSKMILAAIIREKYPVDQDVIQFHFSLKTKQTLALTINYSFHARRTLNASILKKLPIDVEGMECILISISEIYFLCRPY